MKTSEVLRKAADEIRRRGWYQGAYGDKLSQPNTCRVCAIGALNVAAGADPDGYVFVDTPEAIAATPFLELATGEPHVAAWNDVEGRTVEEVLDAFTRAAELAEQAEQTAVANNEAGIWAGTNSEDRARIRAAEWAGTNEDDRRAIRARQERKVA